MQVGLGREVLAYYCSTTTYFDASWYYDNVWKYVDSRMFVCKYVSLTGDREYDQQVPSTKGNRKNM